MSGEPNSAPARKVPATAMASPRSSGWTALVASAGPTVCSAPAPETAHGEQRARQQRRPGGEGHDRRARLRRPACRRRRHAGCPGRAVVPRAPEPTRLAAFATRTRAPITDADWLAASSATGTYEPSSPRHAPALTPARHPASTPGRVHSRPGGRSGTRANGGSRSRNNAGTQVTSGGPCGQQQGGQQRALGEQAGDQGAEEQADARGQVDLGQGRDCRPRSADAVGLAAGPPGAAGRSLRQLAEREGDQRGRDRHDGRAEREQ